MRVARFTLLVAVLAASLAAAAVAIAASGGHATRKARTSRTRAHAATINATSISHFGILRRAITGADQLPDALAHGFPAGVAPGLARRASSTLANFHAWVVPGDNETCLTLGDSSNGGAAGCDAAQRVDDNGFIMTIGGSRSPVGKLRAYETIVAGLVPDGIRTVKLTMKDGATHTMTVHDNVYTADVTAVPTTVSFVKPDGNTHQQAVPYFGE